MANAKDRQITRLIRGAVKRLKRGEIPVEPPPRQMSAEESRHFVEGLKVHRRSLQAQRKRLQFDASRRGYKRFLQVDAEIERLDRVLIGDE